MKFQKLELDDLILRAQKPSRYVGGEVNSIVKDLLSMRATWALCFPDTYEVGMSNVGFRVLYDVLNARPDVACERAFMPWPDMASLLRERGLPLSSLESRAPLRDFDVLGFSLQFEACYTTCLAMLDLAGVPLSSADRTSADPLVIAGGPCAVNGEPVAPFFDALVIGDGEEVVCEITDVVVDWKGSGGSRGELLRRLARIRGVYVPSLFEMRYARGGTLEAIIPLLPGYERVERRVVADLNELPHSDRPILPYMQAVHDRLPLEIQRGCTRGCRFCQAGMLTRPVRQRSPQQVLELAERGLENSGFEEVGFLSLSAGDYGCINPLLEEFFTRFAPDRIAISLPSLRTETMTDGLARQIAKVRKTGFTIAPEAATDRLRRVINKGNSEENLLKAVERVFRAGWRLVKLYFMIGLPSETEEDVRAIAELAKKALRQSRAIRSDTQINVAVSTFIPKPFTPFQWEPMLSLQETIGKHDLLRAAFPRKGGLIYKYHEAKGSLVEGALARGDRRVATALLAAARAGQMLDNWTEHFDFGRWEQAFAAMEREHGVSLAFMANRERAESELFPWDVIDVGVKKEYLLEERARSRQGLSQPDCVDGPCGACGACDFDAVVNRVYRVEDYVPAPGPVAPPAPEEKAERCVVRVRYGKAGPAIAVSHLETITMLLRALRRARLPVAYSQGHSPRPRVSFSPACPVGIESRAEYVDLEFTRPIDAAQVAALLGAQLPPAFPLLAAEAVGPKSPSLNAAIGEMVYLARFPDGVDPQALERSAAAFEAAERWEIKRELKKTGRGIKVIELRGLVRGLRVAGPREVEFRLKAGSGSSAKPSEVVASVFGSCGPGRLSKTEVRFVEAPAPESKPPDASEPLIGVIPEGRVPGEAP